MFSYSTGYYFSPPVDQYLKFKNRCSLLYTVMQLRGIIVALFPVWKWDQGQLLFSAKEIESASSEAENC
jgi:hypothetical protein